MDLKNALIFLGILVNCLNISYAIDLNRYIDDILTAEQIQYSSTLFDIIPEDKAKRIQELYPNIQACFNSPEFPVNQQIYSYSLKTTIKKYFVSLLNLL